MKLRDKKIELLLCKRNDDTYQEIRNRHYIPNKGTAGQQLHHLVFFENELVGIITASSAFWAVKPRDDFFGITTENRKEALNSIVNNSVFRIEKHIPNLGSRIISKWRKTVQQQWELMYGIAVAGFETFVIEKGERRGILYEADNWTYLGETKGYGKSSSGLKSKSVRPKTGKKRIYAYRVKDVPLCTKYVSSWRMENLEHRARARKLAEQKKKMYRQSYERIEALLDLEEGPYLQFKLDQ